MPSSRADQRATDEMYMRRCLDLAEQYRGRTAPNPIVGCVILDSQGNLVAEGAHAGPGHLHAEAAALATLKSAKARQRARAGTLYCNLEPCTHTGRTPPCTPAIKDAGLSRVVIGSEDPIPEHGGGIESLRRGGVKVARALVEECDRANRPFLTWARYGRPAFTLKAAITLDGKIATWAGNSKWITSPDSRADAHLLRDRHDAVLVGVNTVLIDNPKLTARMYPGLRDPIRVVLDSQLRTPPTAHVLPKTRKGARVIIICTPAAPVAREKALVARGAEVWRLQAHVNGRVRIDEVPRALGDAGITSVLVEGGGEVHASLLATGLADEAILYMAPRAFGGHGAPSWIGGKGVKVLSAAYEFEFEDVRRVGRDLRLTCARVVQLPA